MIDIIRDNSQFVNVLYKKKKKRKIKRTTGKKRTKMEANECCSDVKNRIRFDRSVRNVK